MNRSTIWISSLLCVTMVSSLHGDEWPNEVTNSIGMKFQLVPIGTFQTGLGKSISEISRLTPLYAGLPEWIEKSELPRLRKEISEPFYLGVTEVTQGQWEKVMKSRPWKSKPRVKEGPTFPASWVTWHDAAEFCTRLSKLDSKQYRLPSEVEWEYACRANTSTIFSFGDEAADLVDHGWFEHNADKMNEDYPHRVARKKPNPWGFYDMHGNVWEWCSDLYAPYTDEPDSNPRGSSANSTRVVRSGSWRNSATHSRSAFRYRLAETHAIDDVGFRIVLVADNQELD